jgi:hypothetical protein
MAGSNFHVGIHVCTKQDGLTKLVEEVAVLLVGGIQKALLEKNEFGIFHPLL